MNKEHIFNSNCGLTDSQHELMIFIALTEKESRTVPEITQSINREEIDISMDMYFLKERGFIEIEDDQILLRNIR